MILFQFHVASGGKQSILKRSRCVPAHKTTATGKHASFKIKIILTLSDEASGGATRAPAPPTAMIYMEPGLSPGYRHEEEEEGKEGLEEEEEEASPGFVDSWLRRWVKCHAQLPLFP